MARTSREKIWIAGGAVAAVLLAGAVWVFAVSPQLSHADAVRGQAADVQAQNLALQANVDRLQRAYTHIDAVRSAEAAARNALPTGSGLSALTQQLQAQARATHVALTALTVGAPSPAESSTSAAVPTSGSSSSAPAPAPVPATSSAPSGIYAIPISVTVQGAPPSDLAFVRAVQDVGPRAALVTSAQLQQGGTTGTKAPQLTIQMQVFVSLPSVPQVATPTPAPTPTPSPGG